MSERPRSPFLIGDYEIRPGSRSEIELPVAKMVTGSPLSLPILVVHGAMDGPVVWLNAATHGDEVNGIEIIRRVLETLHPRTLRGTVVAVPIVNVPGFLTGDRYLPDRRDLNRSFPGSPRGSLAGRIANIFMTEVVNRCSVGIDLHTGSDHRTNLPQIRADLDDPETRRLAEAFGTEVLMHSNVRDGSLRGAATKTGATVLLFEAGEAWRFDEKSITAGVIGIQRVLSVLEMIDLQAMDVPPSPPPLEFRTSRWVRVRRSGLAQLSVGLGERVTKGQLLGRVHDSFGNRLSQIKANIDGIIIGLALDPSVNQGDAVVHIAEVGADR